VLASTLEEDGRVPVYMGVLANGLLFAEYKQIANFNDNISERLILMQIQQPQFAVLVDIVRSREQNDRRHAQTQVELALQRVNEKTNPSSALSATVGDEFQGLYANLDSALLATTLIRLYLPDELDCRFGIGAGDVWPVGHGTTGVIQDGPGWWSARGAIEETKKRESGSNPWLRTYYKVETTLDRANVPSPGTVNAFLMCRDQLITNLSSRARKIVLGTLLGRNQTELSDDLQISQSAISQTLKKESTAAILAAVEQLGWHTV
jgi:hypothetical protein